MKDNLLVAENIRCAVGRRPLFDGISLVVAPGDLVEVRGANGTGKSTLLRCLAGLAEPDAGEVRRHGSIAYLGHRPGISGRMTAVENLGWLAGIRLDVAHLGAIDAALSRLGLADARDELCDTLSAGQQRRAALARLLVCAADLWVLDEPLTSLDDAGAGVVRELLDEHRGIGGAAVCATHRSLSDGRRGAPGRILALGP